eukprot:CAMPEP_0174385706 /NCGR_PEP_ID=MMETSP0811_2-20130205/126784_1 /TAXON_ID=73025 ORGANISM="Eutreptiella gymnastica-like, Strain CCMP1594" /NCGR_SAMPLE_ID=MMETSP0811_2 /ASSEMBLY_ACC=CAM_ASM_000667 /LENGTH=64 /DNA_ID=CAMNT_0015540123 /DNA_START=992 /DNA_END=1186 /DNA_ORIENTATION=+
MTASAKSPLPLLQCSAGAGVMNRRPLQAYGTPRNAGHAVHLPTYWPPSCACQPAQAHGCKRLRP